MSKARQRNFRFPDETDRQLAEIVGESGLTDTQAVVMALDRLWRDRKYGVALVPIDDFIVTITERERAAGIVQDMLPDVVLAERIVEKIRGGA